MAVLALDLGTTTGWCLGEFGGATASGVWGLKPNRFEGGGMRFVKFRAELAKVHAALVVDQVFFEEVRRHAGTDAAHIYGGLMAHLTEWCEANRIPYEGVPVGTIKKFATGKGNADKAAMMAAVQSWGHNPVDDNEADAIALWWLRSSEAGHALRV